MRRTNECLLCLCQRRRGAVRWFAVDSSRSLLPERPNDVAQADFWFLVALDTTPSLPMEAPQRRVPSYRITRHAPSNNEPTYLPTYQPRHPSPRQTRESVTGPSRQVHNHCRVPSFPNEPINGQLQTLNPPCTQGTSGSIHTASSKNQKTNPDTGAPIFPG